MTDSMIINLPFPGFYDSILSGELDRVEERDAEYDVERQSEDGIAPELHLTADEFASIRFDVTDYRVAHDRLARDYVASFDHVASDELELKLGLTFQSMTSPREYNFRTDEVDAHITPDAVKALFALSATDDHARLAACIADRFTSCDGFISFYSNDLDTWLEKPVTDWDHHELGTLLRALLPERDRGETVEWQVYEHMTDSNDFDTALDDAIDWPKYEAAIAELRAGKEAELRADDPDFVPAVPRCPLTLNLFRA